MATWLQRFGIRKKNCFKGPFVLLFYFIAFFLYSVSPTFAEKIDTTFSFRLQGEPETLDWNLAHTPVETQILTNTMEGLISLSQDLKPIAGLAERWELSEDHKTYTFFLRKGVQWSDGTPLEASHFVDSWKRLLDPKTAAPYAYFLFDVIGAQEFNGGTLKSFDQVAVRALDKSRLEVKLKSPVHHWIFIPSFWVTFPIRKDLIEKKPQSWSHAGECVTIGPYLFSEHEIEEKIVLKPNPNYWGSRGNISEIVAWIISEDATALNLYKKNKIDFLTDLPLLDIPSLQKRKDFHIFPYLKTVYLGLVVNHPALSDVHLRKAIAQAIDRSSLAQVLGGGQSPASGFVPTELLKSSGKSGLSYDPKKAKEEFQSVKVKAPQLELLLLNWPKSLLVGQFLQQEIKKHLGVRIQLKPFDNKTYRNQVDLKKSPIFLSSWSADYPDADSFLSLFLSSSGNNRTGWKSAHYDASVRRFRQETVLNKRETLARSLQKELLEDQVVIVPLYYEPNIGLLNPRVHGLKLNPINYLYLKEVRLSSG